MEVTNIMIRVCASFLILTLLLGGPVMAQQPTVKQLKEQIERMEAIDRDPSVPVDVKQLNQEFLKTRRSQLRNLLPKSIAALRKYESDLGASLEATEKEKLRLSIRELERTLQELESGSSAARPSIDPPAERGDGSSTLQSGQQVAAEGENSSAAKTGTSASQPVLSPPAVAPVVASAPLPVACVASYTNPPPRLEQMALATAILVVDQAMEDRAKAPAPSPTDSAKNVAGEFGKHFDELVYLTIADALFTDIQKVGLKKLTWQEFSAETRRTDKQIGATARALGSTSLFEKPNFSNLLSFAIEHGAIQKEVNETSLTLGTSPYALLASINGDTSTNYRKYDFFNRLGVSANFNITNQDNVLANASRKQLNEWSVRLRINRDRTARGRDFQKYWDANVLPKIQQRSIVLTAALNETFNKTPALGKLRRAVRNKFEGTTGFLMTTLTAQAGAAQAAQESAVKQEILCRLKEEVYTPLNTAVIPVDVALRDSINKSITDFANAQLEADEGRQGVRDELKRLNDKPTSSISYTNLRPALGSYYSVFRGSYMQKAFSPMKLIANGELSIYHNPNPALNQQRLRDAIFSLSFEGSAGRSPFIITDMDESAITYSFTGSYQRLLENTRGPNRKADIGSAQFKLEIPVFTGFKLPLAITYSNATEERNKSHFRFNFGFGLDADTLAALLRAKALTR
jgi:hypothetical protein